jgi:protein-tyrosine phosphatase
MIPLVDMHCHLYAGLDDGPRTDDDALAMCRLAYGDGTRMVAATAHQNERWSLVTPQRIRDAAHHLADGSRQAGIPLMIFPCAEVMVHPGLETAWRTGQLLSVGDRGQYLLLEMPRGVFVELSDIIPKLRQAGVRPILAHPEQHEEFLSEGDQLEKLIRAGCLVQVSSASITDPPNRLFQRALRKWFQRGMVHVLGSDGHSPTRRPPRIKAAYQVIGQWVGSTEADRIGSINGMAILQGLPLRVPAPKPRRRRWIPSLW